MEPKRHRARTLGLKHGNAPLSAEVSVNFSPHPLHSLFSLVSLLFDRAINYKYLFFLMESLNSAPPFLLTLGL